MIPIFKEKLRIEKSAQYSGKLSLKGIHKLKESHYWIVNVPLDGEAPKQYIKAYFYYKNCPRKSSPKYWDGYYAKFGGKSYPHESVIEYTINQIGVGLGLTMNETKLAVINSQLRFLSKDFLKRNERLIHGIEILAEYFEDKDFIDEINEDKKTRREFLTFDVIESAIEHVYPNQSEELMEGLIKMISFDALAGNNDRHFYNWGVIGNTEKIEDKGVKFAPIYDSSRGLFWNYTQDRIVKFYNQNQKSEAQLKAYLKKSEPRFSFEQNPKANHFQLIEFLIAYKKNYKEVISYLCSKEKEEKVLKHLNEVIFFRLSKERRSLMASALKFRFNKIRSYLS